MYLQTGSYFPTRQVWIQVTLGKNCGVPSGLGFGGWETERGWSSGQRRGKGPGFESHTMNPAWLYWVCSQMPLSISQFITEWGDSGLCHTACTPPILRLAGGRLNPWCNSEQPQGCSGLCCFLTVPLGLPYLGMPLTCHVGGEAGGKGDRNHCIELPTNTHTHCNPAESCSISDNSFKTHLLTVVKESGMEKALWLVPYFFFLSSVLWDINQFCFSLVLMFYSGCELVLWTGMQPWQIHDHHHFVSV